MSLLRAHQTRDLKYLLIPYLTFRAYVNFGGPTRKKTHFYGNEHTCTYNQLLHGHLDKIVLCKAKGYRELVEFIEGLKGKYISAKLYMRTEPRGKFDLLCLEWYKGSFNRHHEPVVSEDEISELYFEIVKGQIIIRETPKEQVAEDWKALVAHQLRSK